MLMACGVTTSHIQIPFRRPASGREHVGSVASCQLTVDVRTCRVNHMPSRFIFVDCIIAISAPQVFCLLTTPADMYKDSWVIYCCTRCDSPKCKDCACLAKNDSQPSTTPNPTLTSPPAVLETEHMKRHGSNKIPRRMSASEWLGNVKKNVAPSDRDRQDNVTSRTSELREGVQFFVTRNWLNVNDTKTTPCQVVDDTIEV